jgi:SAM-dependent methyltransferase
MLKQLTRALWTRSPKANYLSLQRRLTQAPAADISSRDHPVFDSKHRMWPRFFWQFYRNDAALQQTLGLPFSFQGRAVLEIGCGPLMGYAPLAVLMGCKRYACNEIHARDLRTDSIFLDEYIWRMYQQFAGLHLYQQPYAAYLDQLNAVALHDKPIQMETFETPFDLILSNAVLEHINDLASVIAHLAAATQPGGIHIHAVDFGNHDTAATNPLAGKYTIPRDQNPLHLRHDGNINLLLPQEIVAIFRQHFAQVHFVVTEKQDALPAEPLHEQWQAHPQDDLLTVSGLIIARHS